MQGIASCRGEEENLKLGRRRAREDKMAISETMASGGEKRRRGMGHKHKQAGHEHSSVGQGRESVTG